MQSSVESESDTRRKLTIEVPPEELAPLYDATLRRLAKQVKVPGFRPGKAPRPVLESRLGKQAIQDEMLKDALPSLYARAADEQSLEPLTHPEIDVVSFEEGRPLTFTALIEVRPEFKLPEYKGLEATRAPWKASDEEVSGHLDKLREQFGTLEVVTRNATKGDYVTIDVFATRHEQKIDAASTEDLLYEVGSGSFVAELDEELEGKRAGDILKFTAKLPEAFSPDQAEAGEATFSVVVKQVQTKKLPPADDEFAKLASEFDTLDELKGELRDRIEAVKKAEADAAVRNELLEDLLDQAEIPIPESLLQKETEARLARLFRELERVGLSLEKYLQMNQSTEQELVSGAREAASKTVAADLLLEAVAKAEGIKVENRELGIEVAAIARQAGRQVDEVMKDLREGAGANVLAGDILRRKALGFIVEQAKIIGEEGEKPAPSEGKEAPTTTKEAEE